MLGHFITHLRGDANDDNVQRFFLPIFIYLLLLLLLQNAYAPYTNTHQMIRFDTIRLGNSFCVRLRIGSIIEFKFNVFNGFDPAISVMKSDSETKTSEIIKFKRI